MNVGDLVYVKYKKVWGSFRVEKLLKSSTFNVKSVMLIKNTRKKLWITDDLVEKI